MLFLTSVMINIVCCIFECELEHNTVYRITGNVCVAKFLSFKFLRDLIFAQTEHAQYKMHVL